MMISAALFWLCVLLLHGHAKPPKFCLHDPGHPLCQSSIVEDLDVLVQPEAESPSIQPPQIEILPTEPDTEEQNIHQDNTVTDAQMTGKIHMLAFLQDFSFSCLGSLFVYSVNSLGSFFVGEHIMAASRKASRGAYASQIETLCLGTPASVVFLT